MSRMFALLLLSMLTLSAGSASAADNSALRLPPERPFVAPPDERQPTLRSLPQDLAHSEGTRTQGQKDLETAFRMCGDC